MHISYSNTPDTIDLHNLSLARVSNGAVIIEAVFISSPATCQQSLPSGLILREKANRLRARLVDVGCCTVATAEYVH